MNIENYIQEIRNKLKEQGYSGKLIDYLELQKLHQSFGNNMSEKNFALEVLQISASSYSNIKNSKYKVRILKEKINQKEITQEEIEKIKEQLLQEGYANKSIDYLELQQLHRCFGNNMSEKDFALKILQISHSSYFNMKNQGTKTIILQYNTSQEEIEKIKKQLLQEGYAKKLINYAELQQLYKCFENNMSEKDFALKVLQISYFSYLNIKNKGCKTIILKYNINQEEIEKIKEQLLQEGYANKLIDYVELQKLHQSFGNNMSEKDFALKVLQISYPCYINVKNKGIKTTILKEKINNEEIKKVRELLIQKGYANKSINYLELQQLHKCFGNNMSEKDFALKVLQISHSSYFNMKNQGTKTIILKYNTSQEEIEKIKKQLLQEGYAKKSIDYAELQQLHKCYRK